MLFDKKNAKTWLPSFVLLIFVWNWIGSMFGIGAIALYFNHLVAIPLIIALALMHYTFEYFKEWFLEDKRAKAELADFARKDSESQRQLVYNEYEREFFRQISNPWTVDLLLHGVRDRWMHGVINEQELHEELQILVREYHEWEREDEPN